MELQEISIHKIKQYFTENHLEIPPEYFEYVVCSSKTKILFGEDTFLLDLKINMANKYTIYFKILKKEDLISEIMEKLHRFAKQQSIWVPYLSLVFIIIPEEFEVNEIAPFVEALAEEEDLSNITFITGTPPDFLKI